MMGEQIEGCIFTCFSLLFDSIVFIQFGGFSAGSSFTFAVFLWGAWYFYKQGSVHTVLCTYRI